MIIAQEMYWNEGKKTSMGTISINPDNVMWVSHRQGYYRVQFSLNVFVDIECTDEVNAWVNNWKE